MRAWRLGQGEQSSRAQAGRERSQAACLTVPLPEVTSSRNGQARCPCQGGPGLTDFMAALREGPFHSLHPHQSLYCISWSSQRSTREDHTPRHMSTFTQCHQGSPSCGGEAGVSHVAVTAGSRGGKGMSFVSLSHFFLQKKKRKLKNTRGSLAASTPFSYLAVNLG